MYFDGLSFKTIHLSKHDGRFNKKWHVVSSMGVLKVLGKMYFSDKKN